MYSYVDDLCWCKCCDIFHKLSNDEVQEQRIKRIGKSCKDSLATRIKDIREENFCWCRCEKFFHSVKGNDHPIQEEGIRGLRGQFIRPVREKVKFDGCADILMSCCLVGIILASGYVISQSGALF